MLLSLQIDSDWTDTARAMGDSMLDDNMETANVYQKALKNYQQYMDKLEKEARENLRTEKQKQIFELRKKIREECMNFQRHHMEYIGYHFRMCGKDVSIFGICTESGSKEKNIGSFHIFYISPYISITEQSTEVIKSSRKTKNG